MVAYVNQTLRIWWCSLKGNHSRRSSGVSHRSHEIEKMAPVLASTCICLENLTKLLSKVNLPNILKYFGNGESTFIFCLPDVFLNSF